MQALAGFVGEAFLSSLFGSIFEKLDFISGLRSLFNKQNEVEVETQLGEWRHLLFQIQAVLDHAEEQQITDIEVETWLSDLKDLAFDMEDVFDQFDFAVKTSELQVGARANSSKPCKRPRHGTSSRPNSVPNFIALIPMIREVTSKLQQLDRKRIEFNFQQISQKSRRPGSLIDRVPSTCLVEPYVYGRDRDREAIMNLLLRDDPGVCVIPIVGMGGLGKTTLAQLVYNDQRVVKDRFNLRSWVCVSEELDILRVTRSILQEITQSSFDMNAELNFLQTKLEWALGKQKFLLILDDVWNESYEQWDTLRRPFLAGAGGSKIIVTTRNESVASLMSMGQIPPYALQKLTDDECLQLFTRHALDAEDFEAHPHLRKIGKEIVKKCQGLPLAAKTLGGLLRGNYDSQYWDHMLNSKIWELPKERSNIIPALRLSYHHLPSHLKRCFVYCAMFPKDYEFDKDELVMLWMAEGFLKHLGGTKLMSGLCHEAFHELVLRAFFQQSSVDRSLFVMHDLIHDLAQSIAGESCFHLPCDLDSDKLQPAISKKARHFSFAPQTCSTSKRFEALKEAKRLRTWFGLNNLKTLHHISRRILLELLPDFTCLRTLCLSGHALKKVPSFISDLTQLRYVDLSYNKIESLPESLISLIYLQTLILKGCHQLTELPAAIGNLLELCFLDIRDTPKLESIPVGIIKLTNLQVLSKFPVVSDRVHGLRLGDLKCLPHLKGHLYIKNLQNVAVIPDAKASYIADPVLKELYLEWSHGSDIGISESREMQVLNQLKPHHSLEVLKFEGYRDYRFPTWVGDQLLLPNLTHLKIGNCVQISSLPSVGKLASLEVLIITGMESVQVVGMEFFGIEDSFVSNCSFQSLEILEFENMQAWEEWKCFGGESNGIFPCLKNLRLSGCPKLIGNLPGNLRSLNSLEIIGCPVLRPTKVSLPSLDRLKIQDCGGAVLSSMVDVTSLRHLTLRRLLGSACLPKGIEQAILDTFVMEDVHPLVDMNEIKGLVQLRIIDSPFLKSFIGCKLPLMLKSLKIRRCENLECLPQEIMHDDEGNSFMSLEYLEIENCPCLESFPLGKLPVTLKSLVLFNCTNLQTELEAIIPKAGSMLEEIWIYSCDNLRTSCFWEKKRLDHLIRLTINGSSSDKRSMLFPNSGIAFPSNIQTLEIGGFKNLEALPAFRSLQCLTRLTIESCPKVESLLEAGGLPHTLVRLSLECLETLKALPVLSSLMSLELLTIEDCPMIESFPEGGLPPNVRELWIGCESIKQPMQLWGLDRLTSLQRLTISHVPPPDGLQLPPTLIALVLRSMKVMKSLNPGLLQDLTSLKELELCKCPRLQYLPKDFYFPPSLESFRLIECPLLGVKCKEDTGEYWPLIDHIPRIYLN